MGPDDGEDFVTFRRTYSELRSVAGTPEDGLHAMAAELYLPTRRRSRSAQSGPSRSSSRAHSRCSSSSGRSVRRDPSASVHSAAARCWTELGFREARGAEMRRLRRAAERRYRSGLPPSSEEWLRTWFALPPGTRPGGGRTAAAAAGSGAGESSDWARAVARWNEICKRGADARRRDLARLRRRVCDHSAPPPQRRLSADAQDRLADRLWRGLPYRRRPPRVSAAPTPQGLLDTPPPTPTVPAMTTWATRPESPRRGRAPEPSTQSPSSTGSRASRRSRGSLGSRRSTQPPPLTPADSGLRAAPPAAPRRKPAVRAEALRRLSAMQSAALSRDKAQAVWADLRGICGGGGWSRGTDFGGALRPPGLRMYQTEQKDDAKVYALGVRRGEAVFRNVRFPAGMHPHNDIINHPAKDYLTPVQLREWVHRPPNTDMRCRGCGTWLASDVVFRGTHFRCGQSYRHRYRCTSCAREWIAMDLHPSLAPPLGPNLHPRPCTARV
eukprot:TRINITY_DN60749_c0_g1_i1.p1 TRINITY_DN60749_c0_g1~~TRINITY_DN60749_c0_g1_i1.p1  ORF type:complete len:518 (+),score=110.10 TRINITY_DN60749_c0_g1_i1:66-1556(+)